MSAGRAPDDALTRELESLREHLDTDTVARIAELTWACQCTAAYYKAVRMGAPQDVLSELLGLSIVALDKAKFSL